MRRQPTRRLLSAVTAVVIAGVLFLGAAVAVGRPESVPAASGGPVATSADGTMSTQDLERGIRSLQARLDRLPGDWQAWAALGSAYTRQAAATADPAYYAMADGAFDRSLVERPDGNEPALTGQAFLAAARHDFERARSLARQALQVNPYAPAAHGVLGDALLELGRYDDAFKAFQDMGNLRPGVPSHARASYAWELRGDIPRARSALEKALAVAFDDVDVAFVRYYLGELEFNAGDLGAADQHYVEALRRDPSFVPPLAGRAKVAAARGRTDEAVRGYTDAVQKLPQASFVAELGDLYASLGEDEKAAQQYELVVAQQRLAEDAGVNVDLELALFDADHGRPSQALRTATREYERRRGVFAEDVMAWALHANGRSAEALPHARKAQRLGSRNALFAYHKGMIEHALGNRDAARADLRRALRINPHFSPLHSPRAKSALAELGDKP